MQESAYTAALERYRAALVDALEIANDPFKAPELTVYTGRSVMNATWDMQVEYAAMMRKAEAAA
jgi:hypothetical protein